jgi:hypothetical protein
MPGIMGGHFGRNARSLREPLVELPPGELRAPAAPLKMPGELLGEMGGQAVEFLVGEALAQGLQVGPGN